MCAVEVGPAHRGLDRMNSLQFHLGIQICKSWGLDIWHGFGAYQGLDLLGAIEGKPQAHLATPDMQGMSQIEDGHLNGKLIYDPIKGQRARASEYCLQRMAALAYRATSVSA